LESNVHIVKEQSAPSIGTAAFMGLRRFDAAVAGQPEMLSWKIVEWRARHDSNV